MSNPALLPESWKQLAKAVRLILESSEANG